MDTISLGKLLVDRAMLDICDKSLDVQAKKYEDIAELVNKVYRDNFLGKRQVNEFAVFIGMAIAHLGLMAEQKLEELERRNAN